MTNLLDKKKLTKTLIENRFRLVQGKGLQSKNKKRNTLCIKCENKSVESNIKWKPKNKFNSICLYSDHI